MQHGTKLSLVPRPSISKTPGIKQLDTFHVLRLELGGGHKSDEVLGLGPCPFPAPFALIFLGESKLKSTRL